MAFVSSLPVVSTSVQTGNSSKCVLNKRFTTTSASSFTRPCESHHHFQQQRPKQISSDRISMLVIDVGSTAEMDTILDNANDSLVVVDYSTSWCGPCKIFAPIFEEMSEKHKDVVFVKVMGDASPDSSELMRREGIRAVPAFHFWKQKKRVKDITGARKEDVETAITDYKDAKIESETK